MTAWLGVLDNEIYVEHNDIKLGPYQPDGGPIPLHTYRKFAKTKREKQADKIEDLAKKISVPKSALTGIPDVAPALMPLPDSARSIPFPEQQEQEDFASYVEAKLAIAHYLGKPIGSLPDESRAFVSDLVSTTLNKRDILSKVKVHFSRQQRKGDKRAH